MTVFFVSLFVFTFVFVLYELHKRRRTYHVVFLSRVSHCYKLPLLAIYYAIWNVDIVFPWNSCDVFPFSLSCRISISSATELDWNILEVLITMQRKGKSHSQRIERATRGPGTLF